MQKPQGITVDQSTGNVFITEQQSSLVRMIYGHFCFSGTSGTYPDCFPCAPGFNANGFGMLNCTACPAGTIASVEGSTDCVSCQPRYYAPNEGSSKCLLCPTGTYSSTLMSKSCTNCTAGTFAITFGSITCERCTIGYFSKSGATSCTPCFPGTYANDLGMSSCLECPAGTFNAEKAATSASQCIPCPTGTYTSNSSSVECIKCSAGFFASSIGSTSCTLCPTGLTSAEASEKCQIQIWIPVTIFAAVLLLLATGIVITFIAVKLGQLCCYKRQQLENQYEIAQLLKGSDSGNGVNSMSTGSNSSGILINANLSIIKYNELSEFEEIGTGGSMSIVFKCKWKGQSVAVKLFKITNNQDQILNGSVIAKNIINFEK